MTTISQVQNHIARKNEAQFRELLRRDYGAGKYRITRDDEVHAYGKMPNSIVTGWYLVGSVREVKRLYTLA